MTHDCRLIGTISGVVSGLHQPIDARCKSRPSFECLTLCVSLAQREFGLLGRDCRTTKMRKRDARAAIAANAARIRLCVKTVVARLAQSPGTTEEFAKIEETNFGAIKPGRSSSPTDRPRRTFMRPSPVFVDHSWPTASVALSMSDAASATAPPAVDHSAASAVSACGARAPRSTKSRTWAASRSRLPRRARRAPRAARPRRRRSPWRSAAAPRRGSRRPRERAPCAATARRRRAARGALSGSKFGSRPP